MVDMLYWKLGSREVIFLKLGVRVVWYISNLVLYKL